MPSMGPMLYLSPRKARSAAILLLFRRTARTAAILTRGGRWSRAVIVLGLSLRAGNRHHNAVGVAAEFRVGQTTARISAGVVAAGRRPGRCSRGQGRPGIWLCGFSPLLTAGVTSFPDRRKLSAAGGRRRPACPPGLGMLLVALRPGPVGKPSGPGQPARAATATVVVRRRQLGSVAAARTMGPQRNELWREGLHDRL
jgi:hypothetical protein